MWFFTLFLVFLCHLNFAAVPRFSSGGVCRLEFHVHVVEMFASQRVRPWRTATFPLPRVLLAEVAAWLETHDVAQLCAACRLMRAVLVDHDALWRRLCLRSWMPGSIETEAEEPTRSWRQRTVGRAKRLQRWARAECVSSELELERSTQRIAIWGSWLFSSSLVHGISVNRLPSGVAVGSWPTGAAVGYGVPLRVAGNRERLWLVVGTNVATLSVWLLDSSTLNRLESDGGGGAAADVLRPRHRQLCAPAATGQHLGDVVVVDAADRLLALNSVPLAVVHEWRLSDGVYLRAVDLSVFCMSGLPCCLQVDGARCLLLQRYGTSVGCALDVAVPQLRWLAENDPGWPLADEASCWTTGGLHYLWTLATTTDKWPSALRCPGAVSLSLASARRLHCAARAPLALDELAQILAGLSALFESLMRRPLTGSTIAVTPRFAALLEASGHLLVADFGAPTP